MILYQKENSNMPYNYNAYLYHDFSFVAHLHNDFELICVLEGNLELNVGNHGELLDQGEAALVLPHQIHSFLTPEHSLIWVCVFARDYVPEFSKIIRDRICPDNKFIPSGLTAKFLSQITAAVPNRLELCAFLNLVCSDFMRDRKEEDFAKADYTGTELLLHRILTYIPAHFQENITLREMAQSLGYEEHYISRCFHAFFRKNFKQFVNEYRIQYARQLLAEHGKSMSITEIAYQSGFQSVRNFNRAYVAIVGRQPREDKICR